MVHPVVIHALNILRALFRDSQLKETVVPYIATALMIAIKGFSQTIWPVCCACTFKLDDMKRCMIYFTQVSFVVDEG